MIYSFQTDLAECKPVNYLWPQLVEKLGVEKSQKAVSQALDLQRMYGSSDTLPVLLYETCGLALVNVELVRRSIGFSGEGEVMILLLSTKNSLVQLLHRL